MSDVNRSAKRAREILSKHGFPYGDDVPLVSSQGEFSQGGVFGVEIPAINSPAQLEATIKALQEEEVYCTRFDETHGSILLADGEIIEMLSMCAENGYGMLFGLGPRPEYDLKASFYRTPFGLEQGRQLNNHDGFAQAIEEVFRLCELGCRGIIVYDLGVLSVINDLRKSGTLPGDLVLKTSSHCMPTNAPLARIFSQCGADSITTTHDLSLQVLQEMRRLEPNLVLDVPTDVYRDKGGYIRWYELAELVQVAAPMFLKMGASVQTHPYEVVRKEQARERVRRVAVGQEYLMRSLPDHITRIGRNDRFCCVPAVENQFSSSAAAELV